MTKPSAGRPASARQDMKIFGKPINKWGWVRIPALFALVGVVAWTIVSAALRGMNMNDISWMAWSGYQTFSFLKGLEIAIVPLLLMIIARWFEEEERKVEAERCTHKEIERSAAMRREEAVKRFHEAVLAVLPDGNHDVAETPMRTRLTILETIREALPQLDGKGKGEVLCFLYKKGVLTGEKPVIELNAMDFSGVTVHEAHLDDICLEGVNLKKGQLGGAHLSRCRLVRVNLNKAFLRKADLREAVLKGSNLDGAHLEDANLEGADLRGARLEAAFLTNANLMNCSLDLLPVKNIRSKGINLPGSEENRLACLDRAILIDTILPDGKKITNENGKKYLREKEFESLVDKL